MERACPAVAKERWLVPTCRSLGSSLIFFPRFPKKQRRFFGNVRNVGYGRSGYGRVTPNCPAVNGEDTRGRIMPEILAFRDISYPEFDGGLSSGSLVIESGPPVTLWPKGTTTSPESAAETKLEFRGDQHIVIGRQEGGEVPYLDSRFRPTQMVPDTRQSVLRRRGSGADNYVSRFHNDEAPPRSSQR
jgi:hypothetical protein